jgi:U3 small nucleolar RNA-associated protein 7
VQGPVRALATDAQGRYMVTAGADGQVKVWDVRKFQPLHAYFSRAPTECLDISQRGLLAVGFGRNIQVAPCWRPISMLDAFTAQK